MKFAVHTLGCKVNQYETQAIEAILRSRGHSAAEPGESADLVIINTCAVTAESGRKSRQALRRLAERSPGAVRAVRGCWAQTEPGAAEALGADIVWGSGDRRGFVEAAERAVLEGVFTSSVDKPFERRVIEDLPAGAFSGHARAYLKLEDGCQNFCSYCVIPYARGRVRSLPPERAAEKAAAATGSRMSRTGASAEPATGEHRSISGSVSADTCTPSEASQNSKKCPTTARTTSNFTARTSTR